MNRSVIVVMMSVGIVAGAAAPSASAQPSRTYVDPRSPADPAQPPFSQAVLVGNTLYLSGTIGLLPDRTVPADVEAEARLVLDNVKATLGKAGMTMDDLATLTIYCSDVKHYEAFNKVYRTYFTKEYPARAFIGSGPLLFGARFELQGIAVKR